MSSGHPRSGIRSPAGRGRRHRSRRPAHPAWLRRLQRGPVRPGVPGRRGRSRSSCFGDHGVLAGDPERRARPPVRHRSCCSSFALLVAAPLLLRTRFPAAAWARRRWSHWSGHPSLSGRVPCPPRRTCPGRRGGVRPVPVRGRGAGQALVRGQRGGGHRAGRHPHRRADQRGRAPGGHPPARRGVSSGSGAAAAPSWPSRPGASKASARCSQERQRIARELHDIVAHHMSVIAIQAEAGPRKVADPAAGTGGELRGHPGQRAERAQRTAPPPRRAAQRRRGHRAAAGPRASWPGCWTRPATAGVPGDVRRSAARPGTCRRAWTCPPTGSCRRR